MKTLISALWTETLKARRSKIAILTAAGVLLLPFAGGLSWSLSKIPKGPAHRG